MIDGLVGGRIFGKPSVRMGQAGKSFVTAKMRAHAGDGDPVVINVIAFASEVKAALLALDDGDSVALSGMLTPKVWIDKQDVARPALDMIAHAIMSAYELRDKQKTVQRHREQSDSDGFFDEFDD